MTGIAPTNSTKVRHMSMQQRANNGGKPTMVARSENKSHALQKRGCLATDSWQKAKYACHSYSMHFSFTAFKQTEPVAFPMLNGMVPTLRNESKKNDSSANLSMPHQDAIAARVFVQK